jgi:hypothetical protein
MDYKNFLFLVVSTLPCVAWSNSCEQVTSSCQAQPTGSQISTQCQQMEKGQLPALEQKEIQIQSDWTGYQGTTTELQKLIELEKANEALSKAAQARGEIEKISSSGSSCETQSKELLNRISTWSAQSSEQTQLYIQDENQKASQAQSRMDNPQASAHQSNARQGESCKQAVAATASSLKEATDAVGQKCRTHVSEASTESNNLASKQKSIAALASQDPIPKESTSSGGEEKIKGEEVAKDKQKKITRYGYADDPYMDSYTKSGIGKYSQKDPSLRSKYLEEGNAEMVKAYDRGKDPQFYKQDTLLREGDIALSPDLTKGLKPLQPVEVTYARPDGSTHTIKGRFADTTASSLRGRVDLFDPNGAQTEIDGAKVTSIRKFDTAPIQADVVFRNFQQGWRGGYAGDYPEDARAPATSAGSDSNED